MEANEILSYFHACENCEPVMCCMGRIQDECGCRGMPVDFKSTDKCSYDCELKNEDARGGSNEEV